MIGVDSEPTAKLQARINELEVALRRCLIACEDCGTWARWDARARSTHGYRPRFCDDCKRAHEIERHLDGRLVNQLVFDEWRPLTHNIEMTRIYTGKSTQLHGMDENDDARSEKGE